jgi:hypothetical protein
VPESLPGTLHDRYCLHVSDERILRGLTLSGGACKVIEDEVERLIEDINSLEEALALGEFPHFERPGIRAEIARLRRLLGRKEAELRRCQSDPSRFRLQLDGIEVTQAIQDMSHSVPLIAGKRTVVRVYLSYYASPPVTVRGEITVFPSTGVGVTVSSANTVVVDPAQAGDLNAKRHDASLSLNFVLPTEQTAEGEFRVAVSDVTNVSTGTPMQVARPMSRSVRFQAGQPLRLRVLGIRYATGQPPVTHVPPDRDFDILLSWLGRAYPVSDVVGTRALINATATPPFGCGDVNAQLAAIRALDMSAGGDRRTHYYALVSDGGFFMRGCSSGIPSTPDPSTVASGPTGPGTWGWDFDGSYGDWYGGHELGHTLGRLHPGFCGESSDDSNYPHSGGQLAGFVGSYVGFDVGDPALNLPMVALPGTMWHDVMTYCNRQWLSAYAYLGISARLVAESTMGATPARALATVSRSGGRPDERFPDKLKDEGGIPGPVETTERVVSVVATVDLTDRNGKIQFVNPVSAGEVSSMERDSPVVLRIKREDGQVIGEHPVAVKLNSEIAPGENRIGLVDVAVPVGSDAKSIELVIGGQIVDTFRSAATPPAAGVVTRARVEEDELIVAVETQRGLERDYVYSVQVSVDGGATWQTMAVGLKEPVSTIDRRQFRGVGEVQLRVIATDGFTSTVLTTETVVLES